MSDFGIIQFVVIAQVEHQLLLGWQGTDGTLHPDGLGVVVVYIGIGREAGGRYRVVVKRYGSGFPLFDETQSLVCGDAVDPGAERGRSVKLSDGAEHPDECFLRCVLRVVVRADKAAYVPVDGFLVFGHEEAKALLGSLGQRLDNVVVGGGHQVWDSTDEGVTFSLASPDGCNACGTVAGEGVEFSPGC